ncbi:glutamyl-tRNA reductase [Pleionea litopenaei]|uniref:Glutamyl-tRNA reductase n=1 Tax=Pleionea litopenaei TaxID=3070815 RepID=A0AA51RT95_9GAMM|nr:glutamyl-tRNA reductase [Pleionea sp. HL-JVS1]WMS87073.1 glutamyl-tRNA reductase [Pleionea sp. HL-JVS1]
MAVTALGINHKTAPVDIRERVAFDPASLLEALKVLKQEVQLEEVAVLSTCNRMEVYFRGDDDAHQRLTNWLIEHHTLEPDALQQCLYVHQGEQAVQHVMRVACGLDSMVLGEPQILGQMKDAFQFARDAGTLGQLLDRLFQHTFTVAKKVRTDTEIGSSAVSVAYAAVSLAKKIFSDLSSMTALYIGAGETIELAARHLHNQGVSNIIVANRTLERGESLTRQFGGKAITLTQLAEQMPAADIVISSTASPLPIVGKGLIEESIKKRRHRPMFMVDLAVPRDIEPEVGQLRDVYLYSVDDLKDVIDENLKARSQAAEEAEDIVANQSEHYIDWVNSLASVDLVKEYRHTIEDIKQQELNKALALLESGESAEKVLQQYAHRFANKVMHSPTQYLRNLRDQEHSKEAIAVREVLGLDDLDKSS